MKLPRITALPSLMILAFTISCFSAFANPFDDGTTSILSSSTNYNDTLYVGSDNPNNTLIITNAATVEAEDLIIGEFVDSTNNTLTVESGALLVVGNADTTGITNGGIVVESTIHVDNASTLEAENLYIGEGVNESGTISLEGEGTELNISDNVFLGNVSSNNTINIGNGAAMNVEGVLTVGQAGSNNYVNVSGSLLVDSTGDINVVNTNGNGIKVASAGSLKIRGDVNTADLEGLGVSMASRSTVETGGELTLENDTLNSGYNVVVNNELSAQQANWTANSKAYAHIGKSSSYNSLTLTNGATGTSEINLRIGTESAANNNHFTLGGTGTTFTAEQSITVGGAGSNNKLNVSHGAELNVLDSVVVGKDTSSGRNEVNIGTNGILNVANTISVGANGTRNKFNIRHGEVNVANDFIVGVNGADNDYDQIGGTNTVSRNFIIGQNSGSSGDTGHVDDNRIETTGNLAIIGEDAVLNIEQGLIVGQEGSGSIMTIRDGGMVNITGDTVIGETAGDNYIYLQRGTNTRFNADGDLIIGKEGGSNRFAAYGGTANINGDLYLGATTNQHDVRNFIHLETTNAVLNVANSMYIGASNSINELDIVDGAEAYASDLFVGTYEGVTNNAVSLTGNESLLYVTNGLDIGSQTGSNNTVAVENGATLFVGGAIAFGTGSNAVNNTLNINNDGTLQTINWDASTASTNIVLNTGSTLELAGTYSGTNILDGGIELSLNNAISTNPASWNTTSNELVIGSETDNNTLTLIDGAIASTSTNLMIGSSSATTGNSLSITGLNTRAEAGYNLMVGTSGSSENSLELINGGEANVNNNLHLGYRSDSNDILLYGLTNAVSSLNVSNDLLIGSSSSDNRLTVSSNSTLYVANNASVGSSGNNNGLELAGTNAVLNIESNLVVGTSDATGNSLEISEGTASIGNDLTIGRDEDSSENVVSLSGSNSTLAITGNLYAGREGFNNRMTISDGASVNLLNSYIGYGTNSAENAIEVSGTNATLTISETLYTGYDGDLNSLDISGSATVEVSNAYIGYASSNNWITISDTNSALIVLNDLHIGNSDMAVSGENLMQVLDGATADIGGNLTLSKSELEIGADSQVYVGGDYYQDSDSTLYLEVSTNYNGTNLVVGGTASFEKDTTITVYDDETVANTTNDIQRALVSSSNMVINGESASQAALSDSINDDIRLENDLLDINLVYSNSTIWLDSISRLSLASQSGLEEGSQLADVADEIDLMADSGNETASAMRDFMDTELDSDGRNKAFHDYYDEKQSSTPAHNLINIGVQSASEQLTLRADNTRKRAGSKAAGQPAPAGAEGPHSKGQLLQGWMTGYGTWGEKSASDGFEGYDSTTAGFLVGADLAVADGFLVGLAGGSGRGSAEQDVSGDTDTKTIFGAIYASAGTESWFGDASLIYGGSDIESTFGTTFDTKAEYDARNIALYLGGGKEYITRYLVYTPELSFLGNFYSQDEYTEESSDAVAREVDSFSNFYLQSRLGGSIAMYTGIGNITFKPEVRAYWMHEWLGDDEKVDYRLIGGSNTYALQLQAPEEDIFKIGIGSSAEIGEYLELRLDLDFQIGKDYSDTQLLGALRYQF